MFSRQYAFAPPQPFRDLRFVATGATQPQRHSWLPPRNLVCTHETPPPPPPHILWRCTLCEDPHEAFSLWDTSTLLLLLRFRVRTVTRNPILSGCVCQVQKDWLSRKELSIEGGHYLPDSSSHSFVQHIPTPSHVTAEQLACLNSTELVSYVQQHISPSLAESCVSTSVQIERRLPVLHVSLMTVPSSTTTTASSSPSWAIYTMTVSHAVGDGVTFFQLLKQLSLLMSGRASSSSSSSSSSTHNDHGWPVIDWHVSTRASHELYPPSFSWRDVEISYGLPFYVGLVKNAIATLSRRHPTILLLDKDAIRTQKILLRQRLGNSTLSSNDVITLALCQANPSMDVFVFTENARNNQTIPFNAGGNYLWEIPIARMAVLEHPLTLRDAIFRREHYSTNQVPAQPYWCGKVGRITSLATITEQVLYPGVQTIGTLPHTAFLYNIPMDVALIFRYDKQCLGVLHNFVNLRLQDSPLLQAILVN